MSSKTKTKKGFPVIPVVIVLLFLVAVILAAVFFNSYFGVVHFTSDSGGSVIYNKRAGITYSIAPMCYQPVKLTKDKAYGVYKETEFYKVPGVDPSVLITTDQDNIYDVYYNIEHPLPSLQDFDINMAFVCEVGMIAIPIGIMQNEAAIKAASLILEGEQSEMPSDIDSDSVLFLYFTSKEYDYLYYYIQFFRTEDGERYLMDRSFNRCVNIGDELSDYFE